MQKVTIASKAGKTKGALPASSTYCTLRYHSSSRDVLPSKHHSRQNVSSAARAHAADTHTPSERARGTTAHRRTLRARPPLTPKFFKSHPLFRLLSASNPPNRSKPCPELSWHNPQQLWVFPTPSPGHWRTPPGCRRVGSLSPSAPEASLVPGAPHTGTPHAGGFGTGHASSAHRDSPRHRRTRPYKRKHTTVRAGELPKRGQEKNIQTKARSEKSHWRRAVAGRNRRGNRSRDVRSCTQRLENPATPTCTHNTPHDERKD